MRTMRTNRLIILLVLLIGTSIAVAGPVGTWDGTFDSGNYGDNGIITDWLLRNDNTTDGQWRLQTTSLGVISFNPSGQYTFQNNQLDFSIPGTASESRYGTTSSYTLVVNGTINGNYAAGTYNNTFSNPNWPASDSGTWQVDSPSSILSDNFNDNSQDVSLWQQWLEDSANCWVSETNQRLEVRSTGNGTDSEKGAVYLSDGWQLDVTEDFSFKIDYHYSPVTSNDGGVLLALSPTAISPDSKHVEIEAGCDENTPYFYYEIADERGVAENDWVVESYWDPTRTENDGTLYISYDASTDKLYLSYTGYGSSNAWKTITGLLQGEWGGASLYVAFGGFSTNVSMSSGVAYVDNFVMNTGTTISSSSVAIPNVVNETEASARTIITNAGFTVTVADAYSHTVAAGKVCGQNPSAGASAAVGSAVNLYLSIGPTIYVNKVTGDDSRIYVSETNPYKTVQKAAQTAINGDTIIISSNTYPENITIDKQVTLRAQGGTVTIGQ